MRSPLVLLLLLCACPAPVAGLDDAGESLDAALPGVDAGTPDASIDPTDPCDTASCGVDETCVNGACLPRQCGVRVCAPGERCVDAGTCLDERCVGVTCLGGETCVAGSCLPVDCAGQTCAPGTLCVEDACVEQACAGVTCDGGTCLAGLCQAAGCGGGPACGAGLACAGDRCVDVRCVGVTCAAGYQCTAGTCTAGCTPTATTETRCADGVDDDCDGRVDCGDGDCEAQPCQDDGRACSRDACAGGQCAHPPADSSVLCRPSVGGCDVAESCTGSSTTCPGDTFGSACSCPFQGPIAGYAEGDGLRAIDASRFVLRDTGTWATNAALLDGLGLPKVGLDVLPLNRTATRMSSKPWPGFGGGFFWESGDLSVPYWIPQGLAGGVAGTRSLIAVSWHYDETNRASDPNPATDGTDKGSRLSFADVTSLAAGVTYRHVLFVEPDAARGFKPVTIHVGGLAWSGSYLYVADTSRGLRVFDLSRILQVSTGGACSTTAGVSNGVACAYGYSYVLPQVGGYFFPAGLPASCRPKFSFVALDRSTSPDSLISGEYDNDPAVGHYGRLLRWPLATGSSRLATGSTGVVQAAGAWYAGNRNIQGAIASGSTFFLNSTRWSGALFKGPVGATPRTLRASDGDWGWMPEGLYISAAGNLWVATEGHSALERSVYFVRVADLP